MHIGKNTVIFNSQFYFLKIDKIYCELGWNVVSALIKNFLQKHINHAHKNNYWWVRSPPAPRFFIEKIHCKSKLEGMWWHDDVPNHYCIRSCRNTISNALMMEVWNSHGKWEVPKPYLIGGSADPMLVCIGDAQILTF